MKILNFNKHTLNKSYLTISILGNIFKLNIKYVSSSKVELVKNKDDINLFLPKAYKNMDNMDIVNLALEKLYTEIALNEIENIMETARHSLNFAPNDYKIQTLPSTFYKCSRNKVLTISPDIFQYNKEIINTTIIKAFCKIQYKENSKAYNKALENGLTNYENLKYIYSNQDKKTIRVS